ncbi:MAG: hypothetical protein ABSB60_18390, partial [Terracidiphilus sp.]
MRANLRPMNLGEILDRTFQIYRMRFLTILGIAVLPSLVIMAAYMVERIWVHDHFVDARIVV